MLGIDPRPLTLRQLVWMQEGREGAGWFSQALLAGVFNRLGDARSKPVTVAPPAWWQKLQKKTDESSARAEIDLARAAFKQYVGQRGNGGGGA